MKHRSALLRRIGGALVAATLLAACGSGGSAAAGPEIKFGLIYEGTGPYAAYGTDMPTIVQMAIDRNLDPDKTITIGDTTYRVSLQAIDSASEPTQAVAATRKLLSDDTQYIVGPLTSTSLVPSAQLVKEQAVQLTLATGSSTLLGTDGHGTLFKGLNEEAGETGGAQKVTDAAIEQFGFTRPGLVISNNDVGDLIGGYYREALERRGLTFAFEGTYPLNATDFNSLLLDAKSAGIDALFFGTSDDVGTSIIRQSLELGVTNTFVGVSGPTELSAKGHENAVRYLFDAFVTAPASDDPDVQTWVRDVQTATGRPDIDPNWNWGLAYTNQIQGLFQAMKAAEDPTDVRAVADALHDSTWTGVGGAISVDDVGRTTSCFSVGLVAEGDTSFRTVC